MKFDALIAYTSLSCGIGKVTLLVEGGMTAEKTFALAANSRRTVAVHSDFANTDGKRYAPMVERRGATPAAFAVERAMYSNANGVFWAVGANALATKLQ